jgi:hypothetical protein
VAAKTTDRKQAIASKYRDRLLPKLEALARIAQSAEEQSWLSIGWPTDDVAADFSVDEGDAIVVMRDDLRDLHQPSYVQLRCQALDFDPVRVALQMFELVHERRDYLDAPDPKFYVRHLEQLVRARYVLVVVAHEIRMPAAEGANSFEAGRVRGASLLFEIETATLRGGFELFAENQWQVSAKDSNIGERLRVDLASRFAAAVIDGIRKRFPSAKPPLTLGVR